MDWGKILQACREDARAMGLGEADADDVAAEAVTRTLERMPEHVITYARRTAERLASKLRRGRAGGARAERGVVMPLPTGGCSVDDLGVEEDFDGGLEREDQIETVERVARSVWIDTALHGRGSAQRMARKRCRDAVALEGRG